MNTRDFVIGLFYILLFLILSPIILGFIAAIICWAPSGIWIPFWVIYVIGLVVTAIVFAPFVPKMYIINDGYTVSFHLDPFFGPEVNLLSSEDDELKQLVDRGPKFHPIGWWEKFDSTTHHEKEIKIPLKGKFETSVDNSNIIIEDGILILKAPMSSARVLRSIARGMTEIIEEIQSQLTPSLQQSVAVEFVSKSSEEIINNQFTIAHKIRTDFENYNEIVKRYGLKTIKFSLGDVSFSKKVDEAREATKVSMLRAEAAEKIKDKLGIEGKDAIDFVLASEGIAQVRIDRNVYELKGASPELLQSVEKTAASIQGTVQALKDLKK